MSSSFLVRVILFLIFFICTANISFEKNDPVLIAEVYAAEAETVPNSEMSPAVEAENQPTITSETFKDWTLECYEPAINNINCQMIQRIVHEELKQNVLVLSLTHNLSQGKDVVQFILPLDFNLLPGVLVQIGEYSEVLKVNRCSTEGCFVEGEINDEFAAAMKKAKEKGQVVLVARNASKISIPFSAQGFTKAYDTMVTENKKK